MDTYIRKFDKKYKHLQRSDRAGRYEKVGTLNGRPVSIYVTDNEAGDEIRNNVAAAYFVKYGTYFVKKDTGG